MSGKIRVVVCDKQSIVRFGLTQLLQKESDIKLVACINDNNELETLLQHHLPDIVICDVLTEDYLHKIVGVQREHHSSIIVYAEAFDDQTLALCSSLGIRGYILKQTDCRDIAKAIRVVYNGGTIIDPTVATQLLAQVQNGGQSNSQSLSKREQQVLELITNGKSNRHIAKHLFIGECTVKFHVGSILSKLGVKNRTEAAFVAIQKGLVKKNNDASTSKKSVANG